MGSASSALYNRILERSVAPEMNYYTQPQPQQSEMQTSLNFDSELDAYRRAQRERYQRLSNPNPVINPREQELKDYELAKQLAEMEARTSTTASTTTTSPTNRDQLKKDEELARRLQAEEEEPDVVEIPPPSRSTQAPHPPSPSISRNQPPAQTREQLLSDEEYARRLQIVDEEDEEDSQIPSSRPYQMRTFTTPFGTYTQISSQPSRRTALRSVMPTFRSLTPSNHPLIDYLEQMMRLSLNEESPMSPSGGFVNFPSSFRQAQGAENLPPNLQAVINGNRPATYEDLMALGELLQPVNRGASTEQIDQLPTRKFTEDKSKNERDKDSKQCNICLCDFESGEELRTLPCAHTFHKDCIDKWLKMNKVCPIDRQEIS